MCGLSGGMSSTLLGNEINIIKNLMVLSTFRGMYGSGAIAVDKDAKVGLRTRFAKTEFCAAEFITDPGFLKITGDRPKIIIAHARAPTRGDNSLKNVHPHRSKHIIGVHNGTMQTVMGEKIANDASDSSQIFKALAEVSVEEFIKNSEGAYALVWVDSKTNTLNFLRNSERPLVFAQTGHVGNPTTMYWSSEKTMLEFALKRANATIPDNRYVQPKPYLHVVYPLDLGSPLKPLEVKQYDTPVFKSAAADYSAWWNNTWEAELNDNNAVPFETHREPERLALPRPHGVGSHSKDTSTRHINRSIQQNRRVLSPPGSASTDPSFLASTEYILKRPGRGHNSAVLSKSEDKILEAVRRCACVGCDISPPVVGGEPPKVLLLRGFGEHSRAYLCEECVDNVAYKDIVNAALSVN